MTTAAAPSRAKRLLVVGASPMRSAAFATWRQMGLEVVLVDGYSTGRYEELVQEFWPWDPRDGKADVGRIAELARGCDGVTTVADDSQHTVAVVAEELGLSGVGSAAAAAARSKARQRELCEAAGMCVPRWRKVQTRRDIQDFYAQGGSRPAVLKPTDGAGGVGAMRVEDESAALAHWPVVRSLSPARTAVIEDFLKGREVCVDAVIVDGRPRFVVVVDCQHMPSIGFLCTSASYDAAQPDRQAATPMIQQIVTALGVKDGIVHAEFKISDGEWVMVETGLRPGGAFVPELAVRITGVDLYSAQARLALGESPVLTGPVPGQPEALYAQSRYLVGEGQVRRFVPPGSILADLSDVRVVNQQAGPGQWMRVPLSEAGRAGYAFGWSSDRQRLDAQLREAIARLGQGMGLIVHGNASSAADGIEASEGTEAA